MQDSTDTAAAMATVMSVAIETVNAVAETAMNTVNRITKVSLEQLQSANGLNNHRSVPVPFSRRTHQSPWDDSAPLSRQRSLATSADARSFWAAPAAGQLAAFQQRPAVGKQPRQQEALPGKGVYLQDIPVSSLSLSAEGQQHGGFSIKGELQNLRQAGLGRSGAGSAPAFLRGKPQVPERYVTEQIDWLLAGCFVRVGSCSDFCRLPSPRNRCQKAWSTVGQCT